MDFYNKLIMLNDEEIENKVKSIIKEIENNKEDKINYIGYDVDYVNEKHEITNRNGEYGFDINLRCIYPGYIKKGTKMTYGFLFKSDGSAHNAGNYYYIDDEEYIVDFCKYISKIYIESEFELFMYILEFLRDYFGYIKNQSRSEMFQLLVDKNENNIKPYQEHGLSWFKNQGNAMCTEYAIMAQNILSIFGFDCYLLLGSEKTEQETEDYHAFNIISYIDLEDEQVNALLDFGNYVKVYDHQFQKIGECPFFEILEGIDEEYLSRLLQDEEHIILDDYNYYLLGETLHKISYDRKRDYFISGKIDPTLIKK